MSVEKYLVYLEELDLSEKEKIILINYLIETYGRLFDEYHILTRDIEKMEDEVTPVSSSTEESAKVRRLHLKDELYRLLTTD